MSFMKYRLFKRSSYAKLLRYFYGWGYFSVFISIFVVANFTKSIYMNKIKVSDYRLFYIIVSISLT